MSNCINKWGFVDIRKSKIGKELIEIWKSNVILFIDYRSMVIVCYEYNGNGNEFANNNNNNDDDIDSSTSNSFLSTFSASSSSIKPFLKIPFRAVVKCYPVVDTIHFEIEERIYYFDLAIAKSKKLPLFRCHRFRIQATLISDLFSNIFSSSSKNKSKNEQEVLSWIDAIQSIASFDKSFYDSDANKISLNNSKILIGNDRNSIITDDNDDQLPPKKPPKPPKPLSLVGKSSIPSSRNLIVQEQPPSIPPRPQNWKSSSSLLKIENPNKLINPNPPPKPPPRTTTISRPVPNIPPRHPSLKNIQQRSLKINDGNQHNITASNITPSLPPRPKFRR